MCALLPTISEITLADHIGIYFEKGFSCLEEKVLSQLAIKTYKIVISLFKKGEVSEIAIYSIEDTLESDEELYPIIKRRAKRILEKDSESFSKYDIGTIALRFLLNAESVNEHFFQLYIHAYRLQHAKESFEIFRSKSLSLISQIEDDLRGSTNEVSLRDLTFYLTCVDQKCNPRMAHLTVNGDPDRIIEKLEISPA